MNKEMLVKAAANGCSPAMPVTYNYDLDAQGGFDQSLGLTKIEICSMIALQGLLVNVERGTDHRDINQKAIMIAKDLIEQLEYV